MCIRVSEELLLATLACVTMCCVRIVRRIRSGSGGGSEDDLHPIHKRPGPPQQQQQLKWYPQQHLEQQQLEELEQQAAAAHAKGTSASEQVVESMYGREPQLIKDLIVSGREISPRSCRDSTENMPRTLQEPAENPPYELRAKTNPR